MRRKRWQRERENEKVSGSVHPLWSLGLVYLQSLHRWSHLALISAAPWYSSYWARCSLWTLATGSALRPGRVVVWPPESCSLASAAGPVPKESKRRRCRGGPQSLPHPDKADGLKKEGPLLVCESLLDKEKTSWQSHLNDVDRWHPIVVVVVPRKLREERRRWQVWAGWRTHRNHTIGFFNEHDDASVLIDVYSRSVKGIKICFDLFSALVCWQEWIWYVALCIGQKMPTVKLQLTASTCLYFA